MAYIADIYIITDDQLDEQIDLRVDLMKSMVGTLYPSIIYDEIVHLRKRKHAIAEAAWAAKNSVTLKPNDPGDTFNAGSPVPPPPVAWTDGWSNS